MRGWRRTCTGAGLAAMLSLAGAGPTWAQDAAAVAAPIPHAPGKPYGARNLPDRIVVTPGADAATELGLAWRTDAAQATADVELAPAIDGPNIAAVAKAYRGTTRALSTENGPAHFHAMRWTGLTPDTAYLYRVKGAAGWSEWYQVRTAAREARPFSFLYFGDTQNGILSHGSRVIRRAFLDNGRIALALHAGDLVAQRDELVHDDEWGEWFAAGGYAFAMIPQVPAPGNHEYVDDVQPDGSEKRRLGPHWPLSFALPANGAPGAEATSYVTDYQGVRFIILDGTSAIDLGTSASQSAWLDRKLAEKGPKWRIVLFHQPIFTCARPNDTAALKAAWKPLFDKHRVDLVLQGHDHCYGRLSEERGAAIGRDKRAGGAAQGPVYVVSVTGKKMYGLNNRAMTQPDRVAEDTELYQRIDVEADRLVFRAFTPVGGLYDQFTLVRAADGRNRLLDGPADLPALRRCSGGVGPDGVPCTAEPKD
mgnify:FL=1